MRDITQQIRDAFYAGRTLRIRNTITDGTSIWLFGNKIVERRSDGIWITNAGWQSATTKERLNALSGVRIQQVNFEWYLNGTRWDGEWIRISTATADGRGSIPSVQVSVQEFDVTSEWMDAGYSRPIYSVFHTLVESEQEAVEKLLRDNRIESRRIESDTDGVYRPNYFVIVYPEKHKQALAILNNQN